MASDEVRRGVRTAALWTVGGILGSRLLGVVRQVVISSVFGDSASGVLRVALHIPDLIFYLVAGGAIRSGFMPVFVDLETKGRDDPELRHRAWWLFSAVITGVLTLALVLVALAELAAPLLVLPLAGRAHDLPWIGGRFAPAGAVGLTDSELAEAIRLTRILLPAQVCLLVGGVLSAALNALRRFEVTSLVPGFYNCIEIGAVVWLGQPERLGLAGAAWGFVVGAFFGHLVWQAWELWRVGRAAGVTYRPVFALRDATVQRVLRLAWPIMLGLCAAEVNLKVSSAVIAQFGSGAIAWFDNATRLARLPDGLFGAGLGLALFPFLSELASRGEMDRFRAQSEHILRLATVCAVPAAAAMMIVPLPLVDALYGHGNYIAAVPDTAALLPWCSISIVPITLAVVMTRAFYAVEDSLTPLKVGAASVAFGIVANILFGRWFGLVGPPLALGLTSLANLIGLAWIYGRRIGYRAGGKMAAVAGASLAAAVVAGFAARGFASLEVGHRYLAAVGVVVVVGLVYLPLLRLMRVEEAADLFGLLRRRRPSR